MANFATFTALHQLPVAISGEGKGPRRSASRRWDNVLRRSHRPLVTGSSPDHPPIARSKAGAPVFVSPPVVATPFMIHTGPRTRMGTVPKLAPGNQGSGLGVPVGAGFQSLEYTGFTPLESSPNHQPSFAAIRIPNENVVPWTAGYVLHPTYRAHDFAPAQRFFRQSRSAPMWGQAQNVPQQRPLIRPVNVNLIRNPSNVVKKAVPSAQVNATLYTAGYPTRSAVAAQIGGGPQTVLGGGY